MDQKLLDEGLKLLELSATGSELTECHVEYGHRVGSRDRYPN